MPSSVYSIYFDEYDQRFDVYEIFPEPGMCRTVRATVNGFTAGIWGNTFENLQFWNHVRALEAGQPGHGSFGDFQLVTPCTCPRHGDLTFHVRG